MFYFPPRRLSRSCRARGVTGCAPRASTACFRRWSRTTVSGSSTALYPLTRTWYILHIYLRSPVIAHQPLTDESQTTCIFLVINAAPGNLTLHIEISRNLPRHIIFVKCTLHVHVYPKITHCGQGDRHQPCFNCVEWHSSDDKIIGCVCVCVCSSMRRWRSAFWYLSVSDSWIPVALPTRTSPLFWAWAPNRWWSSCRQRRWVTKIQNIHPQIWRKMICLVLRVNLYSIN